MTSPLIARQTNKPHAKLQKNYGENEKKSPSNFDTLLIVGTNAKPCTKEVNIDVVVEPAHVFGDDLSV